MPSTTIEAMEGYASIFDGASQRADEAAFKIHQVINSDAQTDVVTEAGPVPSHAKQARLYLESIPDAVVDLSGQMSNGRIYTSFAEAYPETGLNQHFWVSPAGSGLARVALFKKTGPATQEFVYSYASGTEVEMLSGVEDRSLVGLRIGDALNTFSLSSEPGEIANRPPLSLPIVPSLGGSSASIQLAALYLCSQWQQVGLSGDSGTYGCSALQRHEGTA